MSVEEKKILSFDCANRTLGYAIMTVNTAAFDDPAGFISAEIKSIINNDDKKYLFKLEKCGVFDLCAGSLLKNTSVNKRRKNLINFFDKIYDSTIDMVLLEDQPFGKNKYSWAVQEQISMICFMKGIKCKNIRPKEKLRLKICSEITIESYIKKYGKSRPTNKKFAKDLLRWALKMRIFSTNLSFIKGIPAAHQPDIADAILQILAFFAYKYKK